MTNEEMWNEVCEQIRYEANYKANKREYIGRAKQLDIDSEISQILSRLVELIIEE